MTHTNVAHRRTHNLLLISKLLNNRDNATPLTLIFDTLEQPASPLLHEYIRRANLAKTHVIFLGYDTVRRPERVDSFVACYGKAAEQVASAVTRLKANVSVQRYLIIIDSLYSLCSAGTDGNLDLVAYFSSLLAPDTSGLTSTSVIAVYHADVPLASAKGGQVYQPSPLSVLSYLATTLLTVHSLPILLSAKMAQERSRVAPSYGLHEEKEGVLIGLKPSKFKGSALKDEEKGIVLELEHRRKSGRGVREWYFLPSRSSSPVSAQAFKEPITLLDDHPLFRKYQDDGQSNPDLSGLTFELGLTDRQKLERDGVVLPYFDAQKAGGSGGPGDGGRILYDMGSEDDFDEEEDEI